ncbi:oxygen-independent coproporphyrinogen III oxidase [Xanthobacter autotrophicus]|uniref:oxygen-independent coproporphyrinogen III oxidase n=1 Tax=Xanthobacter autotrophicus TaxID=280 RepID=UPI00372B162E
MAAWPYRDERLPRYTSYPTAPQFVPHIDAASYAHWLGDLKPGLATSLYVHIPFCRSMCWYCGCHTTVALRDGPIEDYLRALKAEIALVAARSAAPLNVRHIHFGGGTPTILEPSDLLRLMDWIRHHFAVASDAEIAVEIDPRRLSSAMVCALAEAGVNRASLGVQSFDAKVQAAINRVQTFEQTAQVVEELHAAGITALSFDLIYGLPKQTLASCLDTVDRCLPLQPNRFSVFGYAHVPQFKKHQRRIADTDLPGGADRHAQAEAIGERMTEAGYVRIGLDHFARPDDAMVRALSSGRLRRNFQGYTTDPSCALIGFGTSAIGRLPQGYVQNEVVLKHYAERVMRGELPTAKGYLLSADDRLRAELIERLMCDLEVDVEAVCARHGMDAGSLAPALDRLDRLAQEGFVRIHGSRVRVPERGRLLVRKVASVFDAYFSDSGCQYSRAV